VIDNGTINTTDNGTTVIIDNGNRTVITGGGDGNGTNNGSTNTTGGGDSNGTDNDNGSTNTTGGGDSNGTDNGSTNISGGGDSNGTDNGSTNISGGGAHGSSGGAAGAVVGAVGAGGLAAFIWADMDAHWYLDQAQPLTVQAGDAAFWADAEVEHVNVDMLMHFADVRLLTHSGPVQRHLVLRDGADGVKHFTSEDKQSQMKADLSVNAQTHEFFYTESGVKDGKPYVINSHGWLKHGVDHAFPVHASAAGV